MLSLLTPVTREDKTRYTVIDLLRGRGVEKGTENGRQKGGQKDVEHSPAHTPFWAAGREGVCAGCLGLRGFSLVPLALHIIPFLNQKMK